MKDNFERFDMKAPPVRTKWYLRPLTYILSAPDVKKHKCIITKTGTEGLKPPFVLLCNHNAFMDFKVATKAIYPWRANYVVAIDGFIGREKLLRNVGCICKRKFTNDTTLIRQLVRTIKHGDVAVIYPEARYSLCGTTAVLPESLGKLCKLLDVSLTTVNTGLGELAAKGFVEIVPRQGVFVADYLQRGTPDALISLIRYHGGRLGAAEVRNFCEARMAIDPNIAEWVIQRAADAQLEELGELLEDYRRSNNDHEASDRITRFFHRMYQLSGNSFLALIYHSTIPHQILMYTTFMAKNGRDHVTQNAEEIYRLLQERDVPAARQCLIDAMHLPLEGETAIV